MQYQAFISQHICSMIVIDVFVNIFMGFDQAFKSEVCHLKIGLGSITGGREVPSEQLHTTKLEGDSQSLEMVWTPFLCVHGVGILHQVDAFLNNVIISLPITGDKIIT
jgi:hypothetical protein